MKYRRTRRAGTVALAATLATSVLVATGGAASADGIDGPSIDIISTDDLRPVFGLVQQTLVAIKQPGDFIGSVLDSEQMKQVRDTVRGRVTDAEGHARAGVTLILELMPSDDDLAEGQEFANELVRTVTDKAGEFLMQVPTTAELLAEAEYQNGNVNLMLSAIQYESTSNGYVVWQGAGAFYSAIVAYGSGPGGLGLAPVNIGVLTISSAAVSAGASLPDTPSDDPYAADGTYVGSGPQRPALLTGGTGETAAATPMPSEPYVETPDVMTDTYVSAPPDFPTYPAPSPEREPGEYDGDWKCKKPANQNRWVTDSRTLQTKFQPVGEVHGWWGTEIDYAYSERASSSLAVKVRPEGSNWSAGGRSYIGNDSNTQMGIPTQYSFVAVPVEAQFNHYYEKQTWCPQGYDPDRGPYATHREMVYTTAWTGGLRYGTRQLGGDGPEAYKKAAAEGRALTMYQNSKFKKNKGKTYKYSVGVEAFGVGIDIESINSAKHHFELRTTAKLKDWHLFGNKDVPPSPSNNAIYVAG